MSREEHQEDFEMEVVSEILPLSQLRIFEGDEQSSDPTGFDAVTIHIDGRTKSDLDWKNAHVQARSAIEKGFSIMWNIEMGLFQELTQPLTRQSQFLSLTLALEHFRDTLWKEFKEHTAGLTLYRGSADFQAKFFWDDHQYQNLSNWLREIDYPELASLEMQELLKLEDGERLFGLFCRNVAMEYLSLLASRVPDSLPAYLFLDVSSISHSYALTMQMLNPERFDRFHLALKGCCLPFPCMGWGAPSFMGYSGRDIASIPSIPQPKMGICIPSLDCYRSEPYCELEQGILFLKEKSIDFKLIGESSLTSSWDELDYLLCSPSGLTPQGKRKLQGFCAAGGTVISTGNLIGLSYEMTLKDWMNMMVNIK